MERTNGYYSDRTDWESDEHPAAPISVGLDEKQTYGVQKNCLRIASRRDTVEEHFRGPDGDDQVVVDTVTARNKRDSYGSVFGKDFPQGRDTVNGTAAWSCGLIGRDCQASSGSDSCRALFVDKRDTAAATSPKRALSDTSIRSRHSQSTRHPSFPCASRSDYKTQKGKNEVVKRSQVIHAEVPPPPEGALSSRQGRRELISMSKRFGELDEKQAAERRGCAREKDALTVEERPHNAKGGTIESVKTASAPSWSEDNDQGLRRCLGAKERDEAHDVPSELGPPLNAVGGSPNRCDRRDRQSPGAVDPTARMSSANPRLSLPAAARALTALILQIERLASCAETSAGLDQKSYFTVPSMILAGYHSAYAEPLAHRRAPISEASTAPVEGGESGGNLEGFNLSVLCGAVLDLVTTHAADILPLGALSGVVNVAKMRAQLRRKPCCPGRVQLFDNLARHVRYLVLNGVEVDSVVALFTPCFEAIAAEGGQGGVDRLRRKVRAFLQSAAGTGLQEPNDGSFVVRSTLAASFEPPSSSGGGGGGVAKSANSAEDVNIAASGLLTDRSNFGERWTTEPATGFDERSRIRQQQKQQKQQQHRLLHGIDCAASRLTSENDADSSETCSGLSDQGKTSKKRDTGLYTDVIIGTSKDARLAAETGSAAEVRGRQVSMATGGSGVILGGGSMAARRKRQNLDLSAVAAEVSGFAAGGKGGRPLPEVEVGALEGLHGVKKLRSYHLRRQISLYAILVAHRCAVRERRQRDWGWCYRCYTV